MTWHRTRKRLAVLAMVAAAAGIGVAAGMGGDSGSRTSDVGTRSTAETASFDPTLSPAAGPPQEGQRRIGGGLE